MRRKLVEWFAPDVFNDYDILERIRLKGPSVIWSEQVTSEDMQRLRDKTVDLIVIGLLVSAPRPTSQSRYRPSVLSFLQYLSQDALANKDTRRVVYAESSVYNKRESALSSAVEKDYGIKVIDKEILEPTLCQILRLGL